MLIDGACCWVSCEDGYRGSPGRPALFLDRDGLLLHDPGFLHRREDVRLIAGAARLVGLGNRLGWPVIVVTNQSGIGRGYYGWDDFCAVNERMKQLLAEHDAQIDVILACSATGNATETGKPHPWRKPRSGMIDAAGYVFGLDLARSWLAGDRFSDIRAARAGGLAGALLVRDGMDAVGHRQAADGFELLVAPMLEMALETLGQRLGASLAIHEEHVTQ